MDIFKDEIIPRLEAIKTKTANNGELTDEELKILLIGMLNEEDSHENNQ